MITTRQYQNIIIILSAAVIVLLCVLFAAFNELAYGRDAAKAENGSFPQSVVKTVPANNNAVDVRNRVSARMNGCGGYQRSSAERAATIPTDAPSPTSAASNSDRRSSRSCSESPSTSATQSVPAVESGGVREQRVLRNAGASPVASPSIYSRIRRVESSGNDKAVGDGGLSKGPLQFRRGAWQDGCEWGKVNWNYDTYVWSWPHSLQVAKWYAERYGAETDCERAVCHNRLKTFLYWKKIQEMKHGLAQR